eukprot:8815471-Lingulodinium_polyedra.AAC.1
MTAFVLATFMPSPLGPLYPHARLRDRPPFSLMCGAVHDSISKLLPVFAGGLHSSPYRCVSTA